MPLQKIQLRPGLNREGTNYSNEGGFYDGDKIRFRSGYPEKVGGWLRLSTSYFFGMARSLWNWATLANANYLGIGTNLKYYIENGGGYNDITPIINTTVFNNTISTGFTTLVANITSNVNTISITNGTYFPQNTGLIKIDTEQIYYATLNSNVATGCVRGFNNTTAASHTANANVSSAYLYFDDTSAANAGVNNQYVILANATAVDGFANTVINQEHQIFKYASTGGFYFLGTDYTNNLSTMSFANASVLNGGGNAISVQYETEPGLAVYTIGNGWGAGVWGRGTWGSATAVGIGQQLRIWSNDNYGQDLVFAPRGGNIFYWDANLGTSVRGKLLSDLANTASYSGQFVPKITNEVIASDIQRFVIAFGANSYNSANASTAFDPMLVRWSDQENPYQWVPAITNQAGEFRLSHGSYIVSTINTRQEVIALTDSTVYSMQYLGPPYVWGFQVIMDNISIMGPNAIITVNNISYWMGSDKFYMYSGRVETLPCSLRQYIFADINKDQAWQVTCGGNEGYNEVWWYYCSSQSTVIDKYVIYNYLDRVWYYGSLCRTSWLDSGLRPNPMATNISSYDWVGNPLGRVIYHEVGNDNGEGDSNVPIEAYVQSSDFDIGDGNNFGYIWRMLPDINFNGSNVNQPSVTMELQPRQNSGTPYVASSNAATTSTQNYVVYPQYTIQEFAGQIYTRVRGRQMAMKVSSDGLGVSWQLGAPRIDVRPDGRRS